MRCSFKLKLNLMVIEMLNIQDILKDGELQGQFNVEDKSTCGTYLKVRDSESGNHFPMKVSTFRRGVKDEKYIVHEDDSFDIKDAKDASDIEWAS